MEDYLIPCISKYLFGIECLGCGAQRALLLILEGKFVEAFKMYPAIYTVLIFVGMASVYYFKRSKKLLMLLKIMIAINLTIMILSYLYKHTL